MNTLWTIRDEEEEELYWSNEYGWVYYKYADVFTDEERNTLNLPLGGIWQPA